MVSIAGSKKLKRQMAPQFWGITRKSKRFVVTVKPGAHPKEFAVPLAVFLRDTLQIVKTLREAKASIYGSKLKVDGVVRKSLHHGLGSFNLIFFDFFPSKRARLHLSVVSKVVITTFDA